MSAAVSDRPHPNEGSPLTAAGVLLEGGERIVRIDGSGDTWECIEIVRDNLIRVKHASGREMTTQAKLWNVTDARDDSTALDAPLDGHAATATETDSAPRELTRATLQRMIALSEADPTSPQWDELLRLLWGWGDDEEGGGLWPRIAELALERLEQLEEEPIATADPEPQNKPGKRLGRPPKPRAERLIPISVRITEAEYAALKAAALRSNEQFSAWARRVLVEAAKLQ